MYSHANNDISGKLINNSHALAIFLMRKNPTWNLQSKYKILIFQTYLINVVYNSKRIHLHDLI